MVLQSPPAVGAAIPNESRILMRSKPQSPPLEYLVQQYSGGWQVLLGGQLLGDHKTYLHAYRAAEAQATLAVGRGQPSTIVVGPVGGVRVEFPVTIA
jgi:hypothetical protein